MSRLAFIRLLGVMKVDFVKIFQLAVHRWRKRALCASLWDARRGNAQSPNVQCSMRMSDSHSLNIEHSIIEHFYHSKQCTVGRDVLFLSHSPTWAERNAASILCSRALARDLDPLALVPPRPLLCRRDQQDLAAALNELGIRTVRAADSLVGWRLPRPRPSPGGSGSGSLESPPWCGGRKSTWSSATAASWSRGAAARACGIPHLWNVLEMLRRDPALHPFLPPDRFYDLLDDLSYCNVAVSAAVKADLESSGRTGRVRIIPTGLPPVTAGPRARPKRDLFGLSDDTPVVAFLGLLSQRKGVMDLVDGSPRVLARFPAATFVLAGSDGGRSASRCSIGPGNWASATPSACWAIATTFRKSWPPWTCSCCRRWPIRCRCRFWRRWSRACRSLPRGAAAARRWSKTA